MLRLGCSSREEINASDLRFDIVLAQSLIEHQIANLAEALMSRFGIARHVDPKIDKRAIRGHLHKHFRRIDLHARDLNSVHRIPARAICDDMPIWQAWCHSDQNLDSRKRGSNSACADDEIAPPPNVGAEFECQIGVDSF